uniref:HTH-type transcriptional regulatory protein TyrR n=1 Tax=Rhizobium sp. RC1 TaxID=350817 RepID=Q38Q20_9HYPH|nr:dehalogenase regulator protein [Rhizobium sp. RC1]
MKGNDCGSVSALEALPMAVLEIHGDTILTMNRAARALFGGRYGSVAELARDNPSGVVTLTADTARTATVGKYRWCHLLPRSHEFRAGVVTLLVPAAYMDLRNPEVQELRQKYEDFLEIFSNCYDGIYVADGTGKTLWLNEGFERAYGLSRDHFIGRDARELERLGYAKPLITWKVISTGKRITVTHKTRTGKSVLATGVPLFNKHGKVRKVIVNSRDMTELFQLREQLDQAEKDLARYESELERLRLERKVASVDGFVWESDEMLKVLRLAQRLAKVDTTLLITGESGVGKEAIAQLIHRESDPRGRRFIKINCGAIPGELLESELFGYERGAFTGSSRQGKLGLLELADKGTLFLDEIGEMPLDLQVKLLQVLQDKSFTRVGGTDTIHVDFRVVTATNKDLESLVSSRTFREDLYYRLSVVPLKVPPLRDRQEDVVPLLDHFLAEFNDRYNFTKRFSEKVMQRLLEHTWPGNVRELRNLVERLVVTAPAEVIDLSSLPDKLAPSFAEDIPENFDFQAAVAAYERKLVQAATMKYGTLREAAKNLGVSESTIKRKLRAEHDSRADWT